MVLRNARLSGVLVLLGLVAGCSAHRYQTADWLLTGSTCQTSLSTGSKAGLDPDAPRSEQILQSVCSAPSGTPQQRDPVEAKAAFTRLHNRFDDRKEDPVLAALMVVDCWKSSYCRVDVDPISTGMMQLYARRFDEASLKAALETISLPAEARTSFSTLALLSREELLAQGKKLTPAFSRVFVEIPEKVAIERQKAFERYEAIYKKLSPLLEALSAPDLRPEALAKLVEDVDELREAFLKKCADARCRYEPLYVQASVALARAQLRAGERMDAYANVHYLLDAKAPPPQMFASVVSQGQYARLVDLTLQADEAKKLEQAGTPRSVIREKFPDAELVELVRPGMVWQMPDEGRALAMSFSDLQVWPDGGKIRSAAKVSGGKVRIAFADEVEKIEYANCRATNHVERYEYRATFGANGTVVPVYSQICDKPTVEIERKKIDPILLPEREAKHLQPGQQLFTLTESASGERDSRVLSAYSGGKLVILRGFKSPPEGESASETSPK